MTKKFVIKHPNPINIHQIEDLSIGGFGKPSKCPECEEGILEFIGCDDDTNVTEILYECNICHTPRYIKFTEENSNV